MILPLYDDNSGRRGVPIVNYVLIAINVLVFVFPQQLGQEYKFTLAYSLVPEEIVTGRDLVTDPKPKEHPITKDTYEQPGLQPTPITPFITFLTSMFMHGSLMHLIGNMLFLWIFGDNIEDYLGRVRYLIFYLLSGVGASLAHIAATYALNQDPRIPCLGASGAISGVLGGYLLLFPHNQVTVLMFRIITRVPAIAAIGIWFAFQLIEGLGMLGDSAGGGGVAYGAHIGGFVVGLTVVKLFAAGVEPPPSARRRWY